MRSVMPPTTSSTMPPAAAASIVTLAKDGTEVFPFRNPPAAAAFRRQVNSCCGMSPLLCAIAETFAPGSVAAATIRSFAAADQRRRGVAGLASRGETSASIT